MWKVISSKASIVWGELSKEVALKRRRLPSSLLTHSCLTKRLQHANSILSKVADSSKEEVFSGDHLTMNENAATEIRRGSVEGVLQRCGICSLLSSLLRRAMCVGSRRGSGESYYQELPEAIVVSETLLHSSSAVSTSSCFLLCDLVPLSIWYFATFSFGMMIVDEKIQFNSIATDLLDLDKQTKSFSWLIHFCFSSLIMF